MFVFRRKPKSGRAAFDEFLVSWEKLLAFDPRERRDPTGRLVDFLETIPQSSENGRQQLTEAGRQGTPGDVDYLLNAVSRLPVLPSGSTGVFSDPKVPWERLENEAGVAAKVVNRFRVHQLQAVSGPGRERVDRMRERTREMGRWADRAEYALALKQLEDAVSELNQTLDEYDRTHPEYRDYLRQLAVLCELHDLGFRALLEVNQPDGVAVIVEALRSPEAERSRLALEVLLRRGWQPETLEQKLDFYCAQTKRPDLRAKAVETLAALIASTRDPAILVDTVESRLAHEGLTDLQQEGLPDLRAGLLEHLASLGGDRANARLAAILESPTEPASLKVTVVRLLAKANPPSAVRLLVDAMSSLETEVRLAATVALADVQAAPATTERAAVLDRLVFALRDGEPVVRDAAVESLRKYQDAAGQLVRILLEDRNPAARESAARTFTSGLSPDPTSTAALMRALSDDDAAVRRAAAEALAAQGRIPTDSENLIRYQCAKQDWRRVRQTGRSAVACLLPLLKDRDDAVRLEVVKLLGSLRVLETASEVSHLLSDANQEVRRQAAFTLAAIGGSAQVGALRAALAREGFEEVRKDLENAIRRLEKRPRAVDL
jgi:HEAT repeat protein